MAVGCNTHGIGEPQYHNEQHSVSILAPSELVAGQEVTFRLYGDRYDNPLYVSWDFGGGALPNLIVEQSADKSENSVTVLLINDTTEPVQYLLNVDVRSDEGKEGTGVLRYTVQPDPNTPPAGDQ
ncbi:MAG: hypothetical protein H7A35_10535 [Planctomycetales bacterium]|nr:hypothetical protein [bacterium]UNM07305.1 MAG: hypothetical protein H7A35_10535 [Planctomycetales bacterium]